MNITIKKLQIEDNPANEVTSHKIFKSRKVFDDEGNLVFHEDGIFSDKIFGRFGRCKCGALTTEGICSICNTRVLSKKKIPDFYIKFDNLNIPDLTIDYRVYNKVKYELEGLMHYKGFLYEGKYIEFNLDNLNTEEYDNDKILIGKEAVLKLGVDEHWYDERVSNKLYIPHTSFRKITVQGDQYFLGDINILLINILRKKNKLKQFESIDEQDKFLELSIKNELLTQIKLFYDSIYDMLSRNKKSIITREVRGQGITGAARAVVTNNFDLDEDTVIIGSYFIPTLFPMLYKKYTDDDGNTNIKAVNEELKDYLILLNRQPTIGEKSILAFHPIFSEKRDERYILQMNPIVTDGFAGDFDGDVYLMIALYTEEACREAEKLLPSKTYIGGANGKIRNGIFEDLVYIMKKLYDENNADEISDLIVL